MKGGAIAGITAGIVLFLLLAVAMTRYLMRRRCRGMKDDATVSVNHELNPSHPPLTDAPNDQTAHAVGLVWDAPDSHHWKHQGSEQHVAELYGDNGHGYRGPHEINCTYQSR